LGRANNDVRDNVSPRKKSFMRKSTDLGLGVRKNSKVIKRSQTVKKRKDSILNSRGSRQQSSGNIKNSFIGDSFMIDEVQENEYELSRKMLPSN
jgi:hypothetical protein